MPNFDSFMEDRVNGNYGQELDRLDAEYGFVDEFEEWGTYEDYEPNVYDGTYSEM